MIEKETEKALLILDLDETLIHSSRHQLSYPQDFLYMGLYVYKRPYLDEFLRNIFNYYKVAIWSTGSDDYVDAIADKISPQGLTFEFVWGRSSCTARRLGNDDLYPGFTDYIKPIKKLRKKGYNRERILIVDDSPYKLSDNYGNALYIKEFLGSPDDEALKYLASYLVQIADIPNFRVIEKRGWKDIHSLFDY